MGNLLIHSLLISHARKVIIEFVQLRVCKLYYTLWYFLSKYMKKIQLYEQSICMIMVKNIIVGEGIF